MADILNSSSSMIRTSSFRTPLRGQMETSNEEFSLLLNLPLEILVLVIERMSPVAFSNFRACNHSMRELADSCTPKYLEFEWNRIRHYTQQTLCIATELYNSRLPQVFEEHVCLLVQTLHELDQHVRVRLETELFVSDALAHLSHAFCSHIQTASIICTDILHHRKHFTVNFEMLDMSLRRSFKEIVAMFPILEIQQQVPIIPANTLILSRQPSSSYDIQPRSFYYRSQSQPVLPVPGSKSTTPSQKSQKSSISSDASSDMTPVKPPRRPASRQAKPLDPSQVLSKPTTLIRDLRARAAWESSFGQESLVLFSDFFEKLILTEWPQAATHPDFKIYFNFFLNFPRDQFMTTYKWDMITKQFGPYPQFFDNFTHYGCGNGFIGLVNSVKADEVLNNQVGSYVFRFSRKEPERLTLSYCTNSSGSPQVFHRRKPHDISLPKFLDAYLHSRNAISFHPAPCRLSPAGATVETLEEFVCSSEYFLTNMKQDSQETPDFFCSLKSKAISEASEFTHLV